ncbi:MAG: hypothetical protein E7774_13325 [Bradyrhizobium sp.]|nr:MAG: hypothetical protein E7774_13325 [Bradyrhizobium sp.]
MKFRFILAPALVCAGLVADAATGAELPSRAPPSAAASNARTCHIGDRTGIMPPGSDVCLIVHGSASVGVTVGTH